MNNQVKNQISQQTGPNQIRKPWRFATACGLLAMVASLNAPAAPVTNPEPGRPDFPSIQLPQKARGEQAIRALGSKLPEVAAWYRMSPEKLTEILRKDPSAWLDESGHLLYIDDFTPPPESADTPLEPGSAIQTAAIVLADTFKLHSKPGSQRILYLDFNGHVAIGTAWSSGTINAGPFTLDTDVSTNFSSAEQERIQYIWQRVAEDYAPFDVDVTTEEPAADAITRSSSSDALYGTRVVITSKNINVCSSCGGVAYVGVFDSTSSHAYYQPAWVLYDALGSGNEKYVAEAISHEAGHNLGLSHDGTSTVGYYQGHGSGATGWAPIMGVGYYKETVQWSKGEYPDANNKEDDLSVIPANGAALRTDDFGNTFASAASLGGSSGTVDQQGAIERPVDEDYFSFVAGTGAISLSVAGARSPNLDVQADLYDSSNTLIVSSNPVDALGANINVNVTGGTYYLKIAGVGKGDLTTGYSDYGSLGQYRITGSYVNSGAVAPVVVASATSSTSGFAPLSVGFSSVGSIDPDGSIAAYNWNFGDGGSSTESAPIHTFNNAGNYSVYLTVIDSQGLKATSAPISVNVTADPAATTLHVDAMTVVRKSLNKSSHQCVATVTIKNLESPEKPISGVRVSGAWSGIVSSGTLSATTSTNGVATINSAKFAASKTGTCAFTISSVALSGFSYDSSKNNVSTASYTK